MPELRLSLVWLHNTSTYIAPSFATDPDSSEDEDHSISIVGNTDFRNFPLRDLPPGVEGVILSFLSPREVRASNMASFSFPSLCC